VSERADMPGRSDSRQSETLGQVPRGQPGEPNILTRTMDARITFWSSGMERRYGFTSAEALGRNSHQLLKTIFLHMPHEIEAALVARNVWSGGLIHHHADGRAIMTANHWHVNFNVSGQANSVAETHSDIVHASMAGLNPLADVLTTIAHQLSESLTAVNGYISGAQSMLGRDWPDQKVLREAMSNGADQIARSSKAVGLLRELGNALRDIE
jgi:hypothetical protein